MVESLPLQCPEYLHRNLRAEVFCNLSAAKNTYACLFDDNAKKYTEICTSPDYIGPGYKFSMRGMLDREPCGANTFQPFIHWTNDSSECIYNKSTCSDEGQIIFENGTTSTDRTCRCDYRSNYAFLQTPLNSCYCRPNLEDCSCVIKSCPSGHVLSPDYTCLLISEWTGKFNCPEIKESQHTDKEVDYMTKCSNSGCPNLSHAPSKENRQLAVLCLLLCLAVMGVTLFLIMFCCNNWET